MAEESPLPHDPTDEGEQKSARPYNPCPISLDLFRYGVSFVSGRTVVFTSRSVDFIPLIGLCPVRTPTPISSVKDTVVVYEVRMFNYNLN